MTATTTARFRYDRDRWRAVQGRAAAEGRTASDVVRTLLDEWLDDNTLTPDEIKSEAQAWDWAHGESGKCTLTDEGACAGCDRRDEIEAFCGGRPMSDGRIA